ncbi:error-prone DNA polymerase [Steroidobacter agaridevorans]|uniref:Error-prone DNA polymerase n=1 Tax=Steroidobacter agaridevorans TaxID=2695856 RepID=A0A829YI19_9GAMM|nr:error-prone DNA polymerase [Steroidobacter agaridevorans]GFE82462.1 error-prone DNA polymerase [Steroidobacter agaridevorans]
MYAELHALSNFSFLKSASFPEELVEQAAKLGYRAIAITDECSVAGVVRAHEAARKHHIPLIIGATLTCTDGLTLIALARSRHGYGQLCRSITRARRAADKGTFSLERTWLDGTLDDCCLIWLSKDCRDEADGRWLRERFSGRLWIGVELHHDGHDREHLHRAQTLSSTLNLPITACGGVLMHARERKSLLDVLTAIRLRMPVSECGYALEPNRDRHLHGVKVLAARYPGEWLAESVRIAEQCRFSLDEIKYQFPAELVPEGHTAATWLRKLSYEGAHERWPEEIPEHVQTLLEHELTLIAELRYEHFFLTVHDLVRFAKARAILCQGRGSAANSVVCYCLGITIVDPSRQSVLFERFVSKERHEPPDIDVDFEHERREEVMQYLYRQYGRHRAGLAATVITYRLRSALRDVGKALGFDLLQIERLLGALARRETEDPQELPRWLAEVGFDASNPLIERLMQLVAEIVGFPRHLSQHVGGFVIAADRLDELVPIENASMQDRTVIQWDKDDLESLGLLKVDVLALGMLSAIRKTLDLHNGATGGSLTMGTIPTEDPATYEMFCRADTVGVFQIESRAQMSMLPRLKPREFYDLVVEIGLVRPGPIVGDMVHPYLRRRMELEPITYPSEAVRRVLQRTLGIPIWQEQAMELAVVAAGFTLGEADALRRAMAAWRRHGNLDAFHEKLLRGLRERGYSELFADQLWRQLQGFSAYGFPESHAASFAAIAYASGWLKCHSPAAFAGGLINSQPMGFYTPSHIVRDAREHGVEVRAIDVTQSEWDCTLEVDASERSPALRLGLRLVKGLSEAAVDALLNARRARPFADTADLVRRSLLSRRDLELLAGANALSTLAGNRHHAAWALAGVDTELALLAQASPKEATPLLRAPSEGQNILADFRSTGLSLRRHPLALLRDRLIRRGIQSASEVLKSHNGADVRFVGLVTLRQSPSTAKHTTFMTVEDETGIVQVIVWNHVAQDYRAAFLGSSLLEVRGKFQHESGVKHLIALALFDHTRWLGVLKVPSRDFH